MIQGDRNSLYTLVRGRGCMTRILVRFSETARLSKGKAGRLLFHRWWRWRYLFDAPLMSRRYSKKSESGDMTMLELPPFSELS